MIHQFRDKKQIARRTSMIKNIIICVVFVVLTTVGVLTWTGKIFTSIGRPLWKSKNAVIEGVHSAGSLVRTKSSVFKENDQLKIENTDLKLSMIDYQVLKNENLQLKELFGRTPENTKFVLASILTRPNHSPYDTIIIDVGTNQDISVGERVYANADAPIGEISTVYADASLVMLYSNPGQTTEGLLDGSNASVELLGRGGGNFEMTIPLDLPSDAGTTVLLPGIHSEILAVIDAVISTPTDPIKKVLLHSPVNIQSLKWVQVKKD